MPNISFGERVRRARILNALTQAELGEKMGVTQAAISTWETGKIVPTKLQKHGLKQVLGISSNRGASPGAERPPEGAPTAFGVWVNRRRLERNLSVAELASAAELSGPAIYGIESGKIANPRRGTIQKLERALGQQLPAEAARIMREEATIDGFGELVDFDPHDDRSLPAVPGIYVLYDISERPIYVGQAASIRDRIRSHQEKFWFKQPIVQTAGYVRIDDRSLREKVEVLLIRFLKSNAVINKQNVDR